jgi:hypothetical protein
LLTGALTMFSSPTDGSCSSNVIDPKLWETSVRRKIWHDQSKHVDTSALIWLNVLRNLHFCCHYFHLWIFQLQYLDLWSRDRTLQALLIFMEP